MTPAPSSSNPKAKPGRTLLLISAGLSALSGLAYLITWFTDRNRRQASLSGLTASGILGLGAVLVWLRNKADGRLMPAEPVRPLELRPESAPPEIPPETEPVPAAPKPALDGIVPAARPMALARAAGGAIQWRQILFTVSGLGLAYAAQAVLDSARLHRQIPAWVPVAADSSPTTVAMIIYLAAMAFWFFRQSAQPAEAPAPEETSVVTSRRRLLPVFLSVLGAGIVCAGISIVRFYFWGEDLSVRLFWLAGIVFVLAAAAIFTDWRRVESENESPRFRPSHVIILGIILSAGAWLRFYRLAELPNHINPDFMVLGTQSLKLLTSEQPGLVGDGWQSLPWLAMLPYAISMKLIGTSLYGLYFAEALAGTLCLLGVYLLTWRVSDRHGLAGLATAITAINVAHIQFSRVSDIMYHALFVVFALWLLIDGLRGRRNFSWALAGSLAALAALGYNAGRIFFPLAVTFGAYILVTRRRWLTGNWTGVMLLVTALIVSLGPYLAFFVKESDNFNGRAWEILLFNPKNLERAAAEYHTSDTLAIILEQAKRAVFSLNFFADRTDHFNYPDPMFNSWLAPLIFLGLIEAVRGWRRNELFLSLIGVLLILGLGGFLTVDAPSWPRVFTIIPLAAILIANIVTQLGGDVAAWLAPDSPRRVRVQRGLIGVALILLIGLGWSDWNRYSEWGQNNGNEPTRIGRYLASLSPEITACDLAGPHTFQMIQIEFLAWPRELIDLPGDAPPAEFTVCSGPPLVWIIYHNHHDRLASIVASWPGGVLTDHLDQDGNLLFTSYLVK